MTSNKFYELPVSSRNGENAAVVIIGSGISGICMAVDLIRRNNCHNFIILEKGSGVGGVWRDNVYPGCGCDIASHLYCFSFEQNLKWTRKHAGQEEILDYLTHVAEKWGLYKHIRFNSTVEKAQWDGKKHKWNTTVKVDGGKDAEYRSSYVISSDILVSAVGQLNSPAYPSIPGIDTFQGRIMHSARWDLNYDLEGKRVAVIGSGSSSVQITPDVAKRASEVTVFQRSPNWVLPKNDVPFAGLWKQALRARPIQALYRAHLMNVQESFHSGIFDDQSKLSNSFRRMVEKEMKNQLVDKPELWEQLTPNYPPGCKRIIVSDEYYAALNRPNVHLETRAISAFTPANIIVEDGGKLDFDLVILATGFRTLDFMHPIQVTGCSGRSLAEIWHEGANAYKGVTVESLPNFGMLYGPNTSVSHNSIILMIEAQSRYISALIQPVLDARHQGKSLFFSPRSDVAQHYNTELQKVLQQSSYANPNCTSWFKNQAGKIITSWSDTVIMYQKELSQINWNDFSLGGNAKDSIAGSTIYIGRVEEELSLSYRAVFMFACFAAGTGAAMLLI